MTIHKYKLPLVQRPIVKAPLHAQPLSVGLDPQGDLCVWMVVDPAVVKLEPFQFFIVGTGHPIPGEVRISFLGTVKQDEFMWHVFHSSF